MRASVSVPDFFNIGQIAGTTGRQLGQNQVLLRDEKSLEAARLIYRPCNAMVPRIIEGDAINIRQNIDRYWFPAKADESSSVREIPHGEICQWSPKTAERGVHCPSIVLISLYEKVEVLSCARLCIKGNSVPANN